MLRYDRPLHGVPILLKNNLATMDRMNTTGLSLLSRDSPQVVQC